jgi:hypothetical protein
MVPVNVRQLFLDGAAVVLDAVGDESVAKAWHNDSVLEEQAVASLAGHLARGGVWVVDDYLDGPPPSAPPDFASAGEYFAAIADAFDENAQRAARERGATVGAVGQAQLVAQLADRLHALEARLRSEPEDRLMAVIAGRTMRLDDYLVTRIVEQTVHLDDLARSVGRDPWSVAVEAQALVIAVGAEIGRRRYGATAMLRALYRSGFAEPTLPVL